MNSQNNASSPKPSIAIEISPENTILVANDTQNIKFKLSLINMTEYENESVE